MKQIIFSDIYYHSVASFQNNGKVDDSFQLGMGFALLVAIKLKCFKKIQLMKLAKIILLVTIVSRYDKTMPNTFRILLRHFE